MNKVESTLVQYSWEVLGQLKATVLVWSRIAGLGAYTVEACTQLSQRPLVGRSHATLTTT